MINEILLTIGILLILRAIYKWVTQNHDYFTKRGIKQMTPAFLFGNTGGFLTGKYTATEHALRIYNAFPNERISGFFEFLAPLYLVRDLLLIKQLAVKDFDHFEDHRSFMSDESDSLLPNSLIMMKGEKWRDMRATLSPAFTGSKMRQMFDLVAECADELISHLQQRAKSGEIINFEMKDLFTHYANDVIASCAFGIKVNSLKDPENEFLASGKKFMKFTEPSAIFKVLAIRAFPSIAKRFDIDIIDKDVSKFFRSMVLDTMDVREKKKIHRPDMINILMQVRKGMVSAPGADDQIGSDGFATVEESNVGKAIVKRQWTDNQIVAQCFLFFLAGLETSSNLLTLFAYELTANPDIQQKLHEEIKETHESRRGKRVSYDTLQKMKYMDQVLSEALRKWPPAPQVDRVCVKDYSFDDGSIQLNIKKGSLLIIPVYGIHHDPKYYPNPEKFDPERFSDENKNNIVPGSYIPFGVGPRNCIASRFAIMELKAIVYYLLLDFSLERNDRTEIPLVLKKTPLRITPVNGFHLQLKPRA